MNSLPLAPFLFESSLISYLLRRLYPASTAWRYTTLPVTISPTKKISSASLIPQAPETEPFPPLRRHLFLPGPKKQQILCRNSSSCFRTPLYIFPVPGRKTEETTPYRFFLLPLYQDLLGLPPGPFCTYRRDCIFPVEVITAPCPGPPDFPSACLPFPSVPPHIRTPISVPPVPVNFVFSLSPEAIISYQDFHVIYRRAI